MSESDLKVRPDDAAALAEPTTDALAPAPAVALPPANRPTLTKVCGCTVAALMSCAPATCAIDLGCGRDDAISVHGAALLVGACGHLPDEGDQAVRELRELQALLSKKPQSADVFTDLANIYAELGYEGTKALIELLGADAVTRVSEGAASYPDC